MSLGIDYGLGRTNIDTATRIRYGVISQHSLASWFYDEYEPVYGEPHCPKCGYASVDASTLSAEQLNTTDEEYEQGSGCTDYACHNCRYTFDSSEAFPDEPIGHELKTSEYTAIDCLDSDVMLLKSPYYTYAPFCSPCVPGAGNLDDAWMGGAVRIEETVDRQFMVLVNGFQWGGEYDTAGAGNATFETESEAIHTFASEQHVGAKTYCFSHDYFEDGKAPYRVFRVEDDSEVMPEDK